MTRQSLAPYGLALLVACGGGEAAAPAPAAAPRAAAASAAPPAKPAPLSDAERARLRFDALSKELDKLPGDTALDPAWIAAEMKEILELDSAHPAARFNRAVLAEKSGKADEARELYVDITEEHGDFVPALENLAAYYAESGDPAKAMNIYEKIIERDAKNVTSRLAMARLQQRAGKHQEAIELCRKALQTKADAIEAFRVLAQSYKATGNIPMAELIIGKGFQLNKEDVELHALTAEIMLDRDDVAGGVGKLKEVIRMDPDRLSARARLADIAITYRDYGNAAQQYEAILKKQASHRGAQIGLAVSYKGLGRYEQAEAIYTKLLSANKEDLDALWNLAVLYDHHLNKYDEAIATYKAYKDSAPGNDAQAAQVDASIARINKTKNDRAEQEARIAREQKKLAAIKAACDKAAGGGKADKEAEAIGNESERIEVAWQLMVEAQTALQNGDLAGGEHNVKCAFGILPDSPAAKTSACAPMYVMWTQLLYQLGRLDEAMLNINHALKCDPENPDAQLIKQQLAEIVKQQKEQQAAPGAGGQPAPAQPAAGGGK